MQIQNALLTGSTTVYGPITFVSGSIIGSASYAQTSSYADTFTVAGSLTAQTLVVQTITSSVSFITGSTRFGSLLSNTHTFTGSLQVTGSGPHTVFGNVQVGNNASVGTTTPVILSLGGTFNSGTAGSNVKLRVYESTSDGAIGGMSVSSGQMEINTWSSGRIAFYRGTTQTAVFDTGGSLGIGTATPLSRLHLETSSVSNGNILTLRNSAAWSTPMMTSIAIRDASNDVGAIGWRYNAAGTTVDMHIHSLYNSAYTNINNIVMTVRGNGNVGIGTVLPNASLHVSGSGSGSLMQISSHVSSSIFFVSGSGNIGIGTTTPSAKLEVNVGLNSLKISGRDTYVDSTEDPTNANIYVTQAGVGDFSQLAGNLVLQARTQGTVYRDIIFAGGLSNGDALMTILGEGNVGMGTNSPSYRLVVNSGIEGISAGISGATYGIRFDNGGTFSSGMSTIHGVDSTLTGTYQPIMINGSDVRFGTSATERMRITSAGNVGIGTTSPVSLLSISKTLSADATYLTLDNKTNTKYNWGINWAVNDSSTIPVAAIRAIYPVDNDISLAFYTYNGSGNVNERMRITSGGAALIGKTTTAAFGTAGWQFDPAGSGLAVFAINNNEAFIFNNINTGTTYEIDFRTNAIERGKISVTDSGVSYVTTSDYRVKEDLREVNGLQKLANIKVYDFKFKDLGNRMDGVIAHELQEILPYAVTGVKDGEKLQGVDYSKIVPVLVKSIQELSTKLDEATTRIKTLESK